MHKQDDKDALDREGLSRDEACHLAGIGKTVMYELLKSGVLPARKMGRRIIILRSDLMAWLDALPRWKPEGV